MTRTHTYSVALTLALLLTGQSMAATTDAPVTREQVKAELAEAIRTGDVSQEESGAKLNEQFPQNYPANQVVASKSREQVQAELAEAIRTGNVSVEESGVKLKEEFPFNYPEQRNVASKSREQVRAELAEARRTGQADAYIEA
jgi:hypothetical protein